MTRKRPVETGFSLPEIILYIATFILDARTLSYFARTNRCAYLSLEQERCRNISFLVEKTPSLALFLDRQFSRHKQLSCRSLEVIGKPSFHLDPREVDTQSSILSILKEIGKRKTLEAFSYRTTNQRREFLCVAPQIFIVLRASSRTLKSLNIMSHPCNWVSLFKSDFTELRNLQLALSYTSSPFECRTPFESPHDVLSSSDRHRFLQSMRHLTNLVLTIHDCKAWMLDMSDLHFPKLIAIDISVTRSFALTGVIRFVACHTELLRLRLSFERPFVRESFLPQDLPKLRALEFKVGLNHPFDTFFGRGQSESAEEICARRPDIVHLSIVNLVSFQFLKDYVSPFGRQLQRLDLRSCDEQPVIGSEFYEMLKSFSALVELSITIHGRRDTGAQNVVVQSISEVQNLLRALKDCASLRAMHLSDALAKPLDVSDLKSLQPVPPSLRYISWGNIDGETTFRIVHNTETRSAHAVVCEVSPPPHDIVYDWTSKNTFRHLFQVVE
ncbi:hypothetical protein SCHPADRAFT_931108 [Schizopora paradoxa]|uniref:F-box domain-containing protein n=1 Tax=Schizopora paradoxa TaxID=27342 RepID=A0A0H2RDD9_9AGAM|nr:hypothetical protein SCHPADRAFT_931108 [Schizopora paradoxa]